MMEPLNLLVVDDESGMRLGVERALRHFRIPVPESDEWTGFTVDQAESGEEAIRKIEEKCPDILLLDYKLPGQSGLDILERTRTEDSRMVTVMMTAYASLETAVSAIKQGAFDFLAKPFTPEELKKITLKAAQNLLLARQLKKLAQERQQVRFEFIRVLGHELKSPLNAVEGYLNLIRTKSAGPTIESYDSMIDRSLIRLDGMRKLIADLLDLTRLESGQKIRKVSLHDVTAIARQVLETLTPAAQSNRISLNLDVPDKLIFVCDPGEIEIILNNLVSNAVKYNRPDGYVNLSLKSEPKKLILTVEDNGIGISPEETGRLFQEFVRIKNEMTSHILGSGLGLTIVKKISKLYNGDVSVQSESGKGSMFTVSLNEIECSESHPAGNP